MQDHIFVKGARENNLKNIDVTIPRDKLVVMTGLSGSGKSSLAFDTIYAEGQRRYVESLSSYARMFLGQMDKPDVDYIDGLSPAISIDQKTTSKNPRSTVGTVTEIYDYFRLLWARVGTPHCPKCGKEIRQQTVDQIIDQIMALPEGTRIQVMAPVVRGRKGEHTKVLEDARRSGFARVRVDGHLYELTEEIPTGEEQKAHGGDRGGSAHRAARIYASGCRSHVGPAAAARISGAHHQPVDHHLRSNASCFFPAQSASDRSYKFPSTRTRTYPDRLADSSSLACSPLRARTTGAKIWIFVPSSSAIT